MRSVISVSINPTLILKAKESVDRGEARTMSDLVQKSLEKYLEK